MMQHMLNFGSKEATLCAIKETLSEKACKLFPSTDNTTIGNTKTVYPVYITASVHRIYYDLDVLVNELPQTNHVLCCKITFHNYDHVYI